MHEIITIQQGRPANYLATHFWNAQETYQSYQDPATSSNKSPPPEIINHDIHFRQGIASDGSTETYLPRTLIYDLKEGFGSLRRVNVLGADDVGDPNEMNGVWSGPQASLPPQPQSAPSPYSLFLLSSSPLPTRPTINTTPYFSSFATTYFHPRSLLPLSLPHPTLSSTSPASLPAAALSTFSSGTALFASHDTASSSGDSVFDDQVRHWVEEASSLQALQLFTSTSDGWGGFASRYLEELRDELGKSSLWVFGLDNHSIDPSTASQSRIERAKRALNTALAINEITASASIFVPLALPQRLPPWVDLDRASLWHTAALLEAAVESVLLPVRVSPSRSRMSAPLLREWEGVLSDTGRRKLVNLSFGVDMAAADGANEGDVHDTRMRGVETINEDAGGDEEQPDWFVDFTPEVVAASTRRNRQANTLSQKRTKKIFARIETKRTVPPSDSLGSVPPWTRNERQQSGSDQIVERYEAPLPLPLPITFPAIFSSAPSMSNALTYPTFASLSTTTAFVPYIRGLASTVQNTVIPGLASAEGEDTSGGEEREALTDALMGLAEGYVEGFESDEDEE